eukprot:2893608-Rhodomonas_salina.2
MYAQHSLVQTRQFVNEAEQNMLRDSLGPSSLEMPPDVGTAIAIPLARPMRSPVLTYGCPMRSPVLASGMSSTGLWDVRYWPMGGL